MRRDSIPSPAEMNRINRLTQRLFRLSDQLIKAKQRRKDASERYKGPIAKLEVQFRATKDQLLPMIEKITQASGLKSFAATYGLYGSRTDNVDFKINNEKEVVRVATELGIDPLVTVERVTTTTVPVADMLEKYLKAHPEVLEKFAPYITERGTKVSRWVTPNDAMDEAFGERLSNKPISLTSD